MKLLFSLLLLISFCTTLPAQSMHIGIAGGISNYNGDLLQKLYVSKLTNGFIGASLSYELSDQIMLRGAFTYAGVDGNDRYNNKTNLQKRNLQFESVITEWSVVGEYYLFNLNEKRISPYGFAGLALFHFNPYTYDAGNKKVFLKPLSTEGQGIYPNKKPYSLFQSSIPYGAGFKIAFSENLRVGFEIGFRKLFTDYLDDVSTSYADYNDLLAARGQLAVDLAYREDELSGGNPVYPIKDTQRGGSQQKDTYYFTGINITYRLGSGGGGSSYKISGKKNKFGCPTVPY